MIDDWDKELVQKVKRAAAGDSNEARYLFHTLANCLQTRQEADFLSNPVVRKFLADRLKAALAVDSKDVSDELGITRAVKPPRSIFATVRKDLRTTGLERTEAVLEGKRHYYYEFRFKSVF